MLERIAQKPKALRPTHLPAIITLACNFECRTCIREYNRRTHIDLGLFENVVKQAREIGVLSIGLTGGEPMMHPGFKRLCEIVSSNDIRITLVTNGSTLDPYRFLTGIEYIVPGICFSLDGATAGTHDSIRQPGSYDKTINSIKEALDLGFRVTSQICCTKTNAHELEGIFSLVESLGIEEFSVGAAIATSQNKYLVLSAKEKSRLADITNSYRGNLRVNRHASLLATSFPNLCQIIDSPYMPTINPSGEWLFCCNTILDGDHVIGNAKDVSLEEALRRCREIGEEIRNERDEQRRLGTVDPEIFSTCEYCNARFDTSLTYECDTSRKIRT